MDDLIRTILERVSEGAWQQNYTDIGSISVCAFCYSYGPPQEEHDEDCPVRMSERILKDL